MNNGMNKKLLAVAISSTLLTPVAVQALDTKVSGHVNRMIRFGDDGVGSDVQFVDNTASRSRFRFNTSGDIGSGVTAGIIMEAGLASNRSGNVGLKEGDGGDSIGDIRHSALYFEGNFGRVSLGQTSDAADGMFFADLSGTALADEASAAEHCSSCTWRLEDGTDTGITLTDVINNFDGSRRDLVKYDSPALGPASLSVSAGQDSTWAVSASAGGDVGGGKYSLVAGYLDRGSSDDQSFGISGSYLFSQGTNFTVSYGMRDFDTAGRDDGEHLFLKLGHKWGNNAASVSYGMWEDVTQGYEGDSIALGYIHTLPKPGIEFYAGYHYLTADASGSAVFDDDDDPLTAAVPIGSRDIEDFHLFVIGSRIKFN